MGQYIDTRDLIDERNDLKERILDDWNEKFEDNQLEEFEEIQTEDKYTTEKEEVKEFLEYWEDELKQIEEINNIENECEEFEYGCTLIDEDDFEEYCEDFLEDCGYFPKDFPQWIKNNIDWEGIASDMKYDYSEVEYQGTTYLYR